MRPVNLQPSQGLQLHNTSPAIPNFTTLDRQTNDSEW